MIAKVGPLVRIGQNHLITDDPDVLRKMSAVRSPYRRSIWYDGMRLEPDYFNVVSERDENRHDELRAKMGAGASRCRDREPILMRPSTQVKRTNILSSLATEILQSWFGF